MTSTANDSTSILVRDRAQCEADILIRDHGTMWSFTPQSEDGTAFLRDDVDTESWQWLGLALFMDHRPARQFLGEVEARTCLNLFLI